MSIRLFAQQSASAVPFTPVSTITATDVQSAITEALSDARDYADQVASGLDPKEAVMVATDAPLPGTISYATLNQINSDAALGVIDGTYTPLDGQRILVKDQVASQYNGIYVVTSAAAPFKLTRSADADNTPGFEVTSGMYTIAIYGAHGATGWVLLAADPVVLNVTPLPFDILCMADAASVTNTPSGNIEATTVQAAIDELDTEKAALAGAIFTGRVVQTPQALTSTAGSIAINAALGNNFYHTTTEDTVLAAPSNPVAGQFITITITQGTPVRTLGYNAFWKFPQGYVPPLTATVGAVDTLFAYVEQGATQSTCRLANDRK